MVTPICNTPHKPLITQEFWFMFTDRCVLLSIYTILLWLPFICVIYNSLELVCTDVTVSHPLDFERLLD